MRPTWRIRFVSDAYVAEIFTFCRLNGEFLTTRQARILESHKGGVSTKEAVRAANSYKDIVSALGEATNAKDKAKTDADLASEQVPLIFTISITTVFFGRANNRACFVRTVERNAEKSSRGAVDIVRYIATSCRSSGRCPTKIECRLYRRAATGW